MSDRPRARCLWICVFVYMLQGDMRAADVALELAEALGVALQNWWGCHVARAKGVCALLSGVAHLSVEQHNIAVAESMKINDLQLLRVSHL